MNLPVHEATGVIRCLLKMSFTYRDHAPDDSDHPARRQRVATSSLGKTPPFYGPLNYEIGGHSLFENKETYNYY